MPPNSPKNPPPSATAPAATTNKDPAPADKADAELRAVERSQRAAAERQADQRQEATARADEITGRHRPVGAVDAAAPTAGPAGLPMPADAGRTDIDRGTPHASDLAPDGLTWDYGTDRQRQRDATKTHLLISSTQRRFARLGIEATTTPRAVAKVSLNPSVVAELLARSDEWFRVVEISAADAERYNTLADMPAHQLSHQHVAGLLQENATLRARLEALQQDFDRLSRERVGDRPPSFGAPGQEPPLPVPGPLPGSRSVQERIEAQRAAPNQPATPVADLVDDKDRNHLPE